MLNGKWSSFRQSEGEFGKSGAARNFRIIITLEHAGDLPRQLQQGLAKNYGGGGSIIGTRRNKMNPSICADEDVNDYFDTIVQGLSSSFGYPAAHSERLAREYYEKFTDPTYCESIGVWVQDDEFFFHEGALGMVLRVHYYLVLKGDPRRDAFIDWRKEFLIACRRGSDGSADRKDLC